jgi:hypothetical protein
MPLPNSGVGATISGVANEARGSAAALRQETLFGIAPEQLLGAVTPAPVPTSPKAAGRPTPGQTFLGANSSALVAERPAAEARAAGAGTLTASGVPMQGDSAVPHGTLLGVMSEDMAQALAAARARAPAPARASAPMKAPTEKAASPANPPRQDKTSPIQGPPAAPHPVPPAAVDAVRGGTIVGAAAPAAFRAAAPPSPGRLPPPAPNAPVAAAGTVRSISADAPHAPLAASEPDVSDDDPTMPDEAEPVDPVQLPVHARTQLGVAIPGVAPLRAGMRHSPAATRAATRIEGTLLQPDSFGALPPLSARASMPRGAFVLLGSGLALLVAAVAFALLWRGSKPISVAISADPSGKDRIDLVCEECADGTLISLNEVRAEVSGRKAYLTLSEPLPLGENRAKIALQRPGAKQPELVELTLPPVEYRIRPDTSTLSGDQPRLTLKVSAIPGSKVEVARQLVALDTQGNGEIAVDLSGQLNGPASEVTTFEQAIAYSIVPPSGKVYEGELAFKIGVTPLLLEAPGIDTVTDLERFMLAGRTTKGAELWVAGTTIAVDGTGRFAQLMSIDSVGETRVTVRATEPGLAPRFASFRLQRVDNLESELAARRQKAVPLAQVARNIADHVGSTVIVTGRVEEARMDGHRSLIILQADGECGGRSCLVRLVYGGLRKLSRGENVRAIGLLQRAIGAPNTAPRSGEVPEVDVSLLL